MIMSSHPSQHPMLLSLLCPLSPLSPQKSGVWKLLGVIKSKPSSGCRHPMVCGRPHLVRSAVQTMRRRSPSGWTACQLCNDGAQSCEDTPVRALFTGKLGLMTGRAKTKSVLCERFVRGKTELTDPVDLGVPCGSKRLQPAPLRPHAHLLCPRHGAGWNKRVLLHHPRIFRLQRRTPIILSGILACALRQSSRMSLRKRVS